MGLKERPATLLKYLASLVGYGVKSADQTYDLNDPGCYDMFTSGKTGSGVSVNQETALGCSPWYRAIDLLGDAIGKVPAYLYRTIQTGGQEKDFGHQWYRSLVAKPGKNWTAFHFFKLMVTWMRSGGNAYAYIDRDNAELIPVHPDRITPELVGGRLLYRLDQGKMYYDPAELLHFKGFGFDGLQGHNVLFKAREAIGLSIASEKHQTKTLANSARPGVVITSPTRLPKPTRDTFLAEWRRMHAGGDSAGRTAILDGGMDVKPFAWSSADMELMESRRFSIRDVSNFTGVPAHKLGLKDGSGYNGIEQENLALLTDTLAAILVNIEQELEDKLLTEDEKRNRTHEIQFDRAELSVTDQITKANVWRTLVGGHPLATIAEGRQAFRFNSLPDTDYIPQPANMLGGGVANNPVDPTGNFPRGVSSDTLKEATANALFDGCRRVSRRLCKIAAAKANDRDKYTAWVATIVSDPSELASLELAAGLAHGVDLAGKVGLQIVGTCKRLLTLPAIVLDLQKFVADRTAEIESITITLDGKAK